MLGYRAYNPDLSLKSFQSNTTHVESYDRAHVVVQTLLVIIGRDFNYLRTLLVAFAEAMPKASKTWTEYMIWSEV
jgi:hypothetical protein